MNTIHLFLDSGHWMAQFKGPYGEAIKAVFGTNVVPTIFTEITPEYRVLKAMAHLNPSCCVTIGLSREDRSAE